MKQPHSASAGSKTHAEQGRTSLEHRFYILIALSLIISSCASNINCDSESMILEESDIPIPVIADSISAPLSNSSNSAGRTFYVIHDRDASEPILHTVEKYAFRNTATEKFKIEEKQSFLSSEGDDPWIPLENLDEEVIIADQYFSACGKVNPFPNETCRFVAQYDKYLTYFAAELAEGGMTKDIFRKTILEIDLKFAMCMDN